MKLRRRSCSIQHSGNSSQKSHAAADFLFLSQSNPNQRIELKLTDRIPIREIEIDVRAKLPDNTINELFADNLPVELVQVVDKNTLLALEQSGNSDQAVHHLKTLTSNLELKLTKYKTRTTEINATHYTNPMDEYPEMETTMANLKRQENFDLVIAAKVRK